MTREQFISIVFLVVLLFFVYQILLILSPFSNAIFWSAILAFGFYPVYDRLRRRLKRKNWLAASLMTFLIFMIVIPPVLLVILNVAAQAIQLYQSAVTYIEQGGIQHLIEQIRSLGIVQNLEAHLFQWDLVKERASEWLLTTTQSIGNFATAQTATLTRNVFAFGLNTFFMIFLLFVFLKDGEKIYDFLYQIAPFEERTKKSIFNEITGTFAAVIRGQLLTSLTQALVAGLIFWILGLPLPVFFAAVLFLAALIPVVGASAVWLPLAAYLFLSGHTVRAAVLFALGALVISVIDNIMKPALIGEKTRLPYFLLFFGILGGMAVYGLRGIFIAPVVLSLFFVLVRIYQEKYL